MSSASRLRPVTLAGILAIVGHVGLVAQQFNEKWGLPESPTGQKVAVVLEMVARGDDAFTEQMLGEHFSKRFVTAMPIAEHLAQFRRLHADLPGVKPAGLMRSPDGARFRVTSTSGASASITLEIGNDGLIAGLMVEPGGPSPGGPAAAPLADRLDRWAADDRFSGVVFEFREGRVTFARAYGLADKRHAVANTLDTRFNLGSLNKAFTGAAILLLERERRLDLDAPIGRYLQGFPPEIATRVTVRHLLRHRSGWSHYWDHPVFLANLPHLRSVDDYLDFIRTMPLAFDPGTRREYSNVGYEVLGAIVEAVSGQSYYLFVDERIFRPLGMAQTGFPLRDVPTPGVAIGYTATHPQPVGEGFSMENTFLLAPRGTPAGGGYSTARDLHAFFMAVTDRKLLDDRGATMLLGDFGEPAVGASGARAVVLGGGGPGVRTVIFFDPAARHFAAVLSNYDTEVASEIISALQGSRERSRADRRF